MTAPGGSGCCPFWGGGSAVVYSLLLLPLFGGEGVVLGLCFLQYFVSFPVLRSSRWGRESFCCVLNVISLLWFQSLTLPRGVMGWSVECDCGISWPC